MTADVSILDYRPELAPDFERLNREWLEALFRVEEIDAEVFADPDRHIIEPGGHILFARLGDEIVGTVALRHEGGGRYELTKMAVTPSAQGRGVGRRLATAAIERYRAAGGRQLYLESHSSLAPALRLYESMGFRYATPPARCEHECADLYMIYRG